MRNKYVAAFGLVLMLAVAGPVIALEPERPPVELTGVAQFVAWTTRTGDIVVPPSVMCPIVEARLTYGLGPFARLRTKENCGLFERVLNWEVVLEHGGKLAMKLPKLGTFYYPDGKVERIEMLAQIREHTGCPLNGTMPIYYGHFDGSLFHASGNFQGVCDGGILWGPNFGVSEQLGPIHADFLISLEVNN